MKNSDMNIKVAIDQMQSAINVKGAVDAFNRVGFLENESIKADDRLNNLVGKLTLPEFRVYMKLTTP